MLAGTVYFYDDKEELIEEIDVEEYEGLSAEEFEQKILVLGASKVIMRAFYHNHHYGTETIVYEKTRTRYNLPQRIANAKYQ